MERFSGGGRHLGIPQNRPTEGLTRHGSGRLLPKSMTLVVHRGSISQGRMTTMRVVQVVNTTPILPSLGYFFTRGIRGTAERF